MACNFGASRCEDNFQPWILPALIQNLAAEFERQQAGSSSGGAVGGEHGLKQLFEMFKGHGQAEKRNDTGKDGNVGHEVVIKKCAFELTLDVKGYTPDELTIKVDDGYITVFGNHEEKAEDDRRFVSRQFTRRYLLPVDTVVEAMSSKLSDTNVLTIVAPMKVIEDKPKEQSLPINFGKPSTSASSEPMLD